MNRINRYVTLATLIYCTLFCLPRGATAQQFSLSSSKPLSSDQVQKDAGDTLKAPGPLASDLSPALTKQEIQHAMRKVADWQIGYAQSKYNQDWTYAPLYLGLIATSETTGDPRYRDSALRASERFQWKLWNDRPFHADDEAIGQTYEALYAQHRDPIRIADLRANFNELLKRPDDPSKDLWWWCDALFMAPPALAELSALTHDHRYIDKMNQEWQLTTEHLYDPTEHLFSRDASFVNKTEKNGRKLFWSRGNGWVLAGTVNVLTALPANDPSRAGYIRLFQDMSERIAGLQQPDGLWRTGLLDQTSYGSPEISGSAFFTYAMTWGINEKLLDRAKYGPVVEHAWRAMLLHVYADGRLGSIQPIGAAPGAFQPSSSYVYGVGAFLLAGAEMNRYAGNHVASTRKAR